MRSLKTKPDAAHGLRELCPVRMQASRHFMKEKKLIILSLTIPILFVLLVLFRQLIEYYFRFSKEYKYIYSYGSTISLFIQLFLVLSSFLLGIYIIANRKRYTFWTDCVSLIFGGSLFLYFTTMLLISLIKTGV
jgi:hypothetical protein